MFVIALLASERFGLPVVSRVHPVSPRFMPCNFVAYWVPHSRTSPTFNELCSLTLSRFFATGEDDKEYVYFTGIQPPERSSTRTTGPAGEPLMHSANDKLNMKYCYRDVIRGSINMRRD